MSIDTLLNRLRSVPEPNGSIDLLGEKWLVQKFGGTSVGKFPLNIVVNVIRRVSPGRVAVVCSARTYSSKAEGTTNR